MKTEWLYITKKFFVKYKKAVFAVALLCLFLLPAAVGIDYRITSSVKNRVFVELDRCPEMPVAVVLGTAKYYHGRHNVFYLYRIAAAAELYKAGKIRGILVSGDNSRKDYDEPGQMKRDLMEQGVPEEFITCDYAGFRTLDSIVRAKEVFGLGRFIVVSQRFHCERAVFLGQKTGCEVYGYCAGDATGYWHLKVRVRETLARVKAVLDLSLGKRPRYLGEPVAVSLKED